MSKYGEKGLFFDIIYQKTTSLINNLIINVAKCQNTVKKDCFLILFIKKQLTFIGNMIFSTAWLAIQYEKGAKLSKYGCFLRDFDIFVDEKGFRAYLYSQLAA